jgi:hypothetical protein
MPERVPVGRSFAPILFGTASTQELLVRIFREGDLPKRGIHVPASVRSSGLIAHGVLGRGIILTLHPRHPMLNQLRDVLQELAGTPAGPSRLVLARNTEYAVDLTRPLGHPCPLAFRLLLQLARERTRLSFDSLHRRLPDAYRQTLAAAVGRLARAGAIQEDGTTISIARAVPAAFTGLVLELGKLLAARDPRLESTTWPARRNVAAFRRNPDGAPLLFGTDVRLRNFMALAKHGPLYLTELRSLTGVSAPRIEGPDDAPFGRASIVRTWSTEHGIAAELDPAFPLVLPLRRLLLALERTYPLPNLRRAIEEPIAPEPRPWYGDRYALFGSAITTASLISIGVLEWTFERLCTAAAIGYDRVVVKKTLYALEEQGILKGDRPRGPGFNVRILEVASSFPARDELIAMLAACADAWPDLAERVSLSLSALHAKTREHLRRRGLVQVTSRELHVRLGSIAVRTRDDRRHCLDRYYRLTVTMGRTLSSAEIIRTDSNLYRAIRANWQTFRAFREEAGLPPTMTGKTRSPNPELRADCVSEYFELSNKVGYLVNTTDLNRLDPWLSERIRIQWVGFPQFCEDLKISPRRRKRSSLVDDATKRENCRIEYRALMLRLGHPPSSTECNAHTDGLYKRIMRLWPNFEAFCEEMAVTVPRTRPGRAFRRR